MFGAKWVAGAVTSLVLSLGAVTANAYTIDFTDSSTGTTGTLRGGVTWTLTASGPLNNSQAFDGISTPATSASGLAFETDGYGVGQYDDEITTRRTGQFEWVQLTFSAPVLVNALYFLDLFIAPNGQSQEIATATFSPTGYFASVAAQDVFDGSNPGFASSTFAAVLTTSIYFKILSSNDNVGQADGALAGVGIAPVPVPAAGLLLIAGLGGLAAVSRKRKAA